jgi:uncharacterized protein YdhG (YjbR/CyaY superfamily)
LKQPPATVDAYLEALPEDQRAALERVRRVIRDAAPDAVECISYQLPTFKQGGMLLSFGAAAKHCALYPGAGVVEAFREELAPFSTSKGTIRFQPVSPLPEDLLRRIVAARLADLAAKRPKR